VKKFIKKELPRIHASPNPIRNPSAKLIHKENPCPLRKNTDFHCRPLQWPRPDVRVHPFGANT